MGQDDEGISSAGRWCLDPRLRNRAGHSGGARYFCGMETPEKVLSRRIDNCATEFDRRQLWP